MNDDISARQRALKQIWSSSGFDDLLEIMAREPAARDRDLAVELRNESDACGNPELAKRLRHMADAVEQIHTSVNRFAAIEGMADLLSLHKEFPFCWLSKFNRILGAFWADALHGEQVAKRDALRRPLCFLKDVYVAVHLLTRMPELGAELKVKAFKENQLLCNPDFHSFLDERARFAASHGDSSAQPCRELASYVRDACKTLRAITQLENAVPGEGPIPIRLPLPLEMAEVWFMVSEEFSIAMGNVAADVNSGSQTLEAGIQAALRIGRAVGDQSGSGDTFVRAAFLEHLLLIANGGVIKQAIDSYRELIDCGQWVSEESRATYILRYSKALLNHWQPLSDPLTRLSDAITLINNVLSAVDVNVSPRLTRDLFFARARLLENTGIWKPSAYESAAADYSRGLDVRSVAHELDARGRALTDYANTLTRLPIVDAEAHDRKIIDTYNEALATLDPDKHPLGRGLALNGYAVYLNERLRGEHGVNQERALALAQEAIDLIEHAREQDLVVSNDYVLRALASAYLTKCNVLRNRDYAHGDEASRAARDALRTALTRLGTVHDNQLRGIIVLNLGHVNIDLYAATGDVAFARDAHYAYGEAETLLHSYPRDFSQALLGKAMLVAEVPETRTAQDLEESLAATQRAISILEGANDAQAVARAWFGLAELQVMRANPGDYDDALHAFTRAQATFLGAGNRIMAIAVTRRAAAVKVRQFREGDSIERVRQAKELLITATRWVDQVWQQFDSVEWRYTVSDRFSDVYAEIAWCQATLRDPIQDLAFTVARAKGREFIAHLREVGVASHVAEGLAEYLDQLRIESRLAEMSRWRAERRAESDRSLDDTLRPVQRKLDEIAVRRRLLIPRPSVDEGSHPIDVVEAFLKSHPTALISDITVCRWGTVVTLFGGRDTGSFAGVEVRVLPVDSATLHSWLIEWLSAYFSYLTATETERSAARKHWADRTEELLEELGRHLMQPMLTPIADQTGQVELIIAPGRFAGLPLHAAPLVDARCVAEIVESAVYVPNVAILPPEEDTLGQPTSAMCVVSDPKCDLPSAAAEAVSVAAEYRRRGATVTLLAQVGRAVGREAFHKRGINAMQDVTVLDVPPTPQQVSSRLPDCDHFFYSGHGMSAAGQSGLLLVDDKGDETLFTEDNVLAMPALRRRPLIVLSACETATGGRGASAELFDFASGLLRIGTRFVVGSLWMVVEDCAQTFTSEFYAAFSQTNDPSLAYGIALRALKKNRQGTASVGTKLVPSDHPIYWAPFIAMRGG